MILGFYDSLQKKSFGLPSFSKEPHIIKRTQEGPKKRLKKDQKGSHLKSWGKNVLLNLSVFDVLPIVCELFIRFPHSHCRRWLPRQQSQLLLLKSYQCQCQLLLSLRLVVVGVVTIVDAVVVTVYNWCSQNCC